jgi:acetolactate synthase-1/2/3 large subunit
MLVDHLGASQLRPILASLDQPTCPEGPFDQTGIAKVLAALIPENAIVVDESITTGRDFDTFTSTAQPHDWLNLMGGSIGFALPAAVGAAIAAPDRTVVALEGDGSAMYTLQALWTMARENLNVKVIIFANQSYEILKGELINVGATGSGEKALSMLNLNSPALDWVGLAKSQGVEAFKVRDLKEFFTTLTTILSMKGPQLIEVVMHKSV